MKNQNDRSAKDAAAIALASSAPARFRHFLAEAKALQRQSTPDFSSTINNTVIMKSPPRSSSATASFTRKQMLLHLIKSSPKETGARTGHECRSPHTAHSRTNKITALTIIVAAMMIVPLVCPTRCVAPTATAHFSLSTVSVRLTSSFARSCSIKRAKKSCRVVLHC